MHTYAHMHTCTHTHADICTLMHTDAHMHTYACRHMQTYAHICTHAHIHMHTYAHICTLLPYQVCCSVHVVAQFHTRFAMSGGGEWQEEEDLSDYSPADAPEQALVEAGDPEMSREGIVPALKQAISLIHVVKVQKAQALKQAKHWQASCQKEKGQTHEAQEGL